MEIQTRHSVYSDPQITDGTPHADAQTVAGTYWSRAAWAVNEGEPIIEKIQSEVILFKKKIDTGRETFENQEI